MLFIILFLSERAQAIDKYQRPELSNLYYKEYQAMTLESSTYYAFILYHVAWVVWFPRFVLILCKLKFGN